MKKVDFPYNNFPKTDISLKKSKKKISLRRKKKSKFFFAPAALYRWAPWGGARISVFCASALIPKPAWRANFEAF